MSTTFEQAKRCPKCELPGQDMGAVPTSRRGVKVHTIFCRNEECEWHNTSWLVQINEDGTIPEAYSQLGRKQYPKLSKESETRIQEAMDAQIRAETSGQGEIRNPRG